MTTLLALLLLAAQEPAVIPPVTPKPGVEDLRNLPKAPVWKPGDPVREAPDLRRSEPAPVRVAGGAHVLTIAGNAMAVHDARGNVRAEPFPVESLWREGRCSARSPDPVTALYDGAARRWIIARWAAPFAYCIAVSRGADPVRGGWHLYDFSLPLYRAGSALEATPGGTWSLPIDLGGIRIRFGFERNRMLEGAPAAYTRTREQGGKP